MRDPRVSWAPFSKDLGQCTKCESTGAHRAQHVVNQKRAMGDDLKEHDVDALHITCVRCGYHWLMKPADVLG